MYMYKILSSSLDPLWAFLWDSWRIPQLIAWLELLSKIFQAEMLQDSRCRAFTDEGFFVSHLTRVLTQQKKKERKEEEFPGRFFSISRDSWQYLREFQELQTILKSYLWDSIRFLRESEDVFGKNPTLMAARHTILFFVGFIFQLWGRKRTQKSAIKKTLVRLKKSATKR